MICPKCGSQITPNTKFCAKCGTPVPQQTRPVAPQPPRPQMQQPVASQQPRQQMKQPVAPQQPVKAPQGKKSANGKKIAVIAVAAVLVVAIALAGILIIPGLIGKNGGSGSGLIGGSSSGDADDIRASVQNTDTILMVSKFTTINDEGEVANYRLYDYYDNGLLYSEKIYSAENDFLSKIVYEYDENYRKLKVEEIDYNGNVRSSSDYKYDAYGNDIGDDECEYDSNKNIIKRTSRYADTGSVNTVIDYEYDANGNVVKEKIYTYAKDYKEGSSKPVYPNVAEYKYNADGKLTEKRTYLDDGKITDWYKTVYKYNSDGRLTEQIKYNCYTDAEFENERATCEYDADGNFTRVVVYEYESKYVGEDQDEKVRVEEIKLEYVYSYDGNGNLTKFVLYEGEEADGDSTEIQIEYSEQTVSSPADEDVIKANQKKITDAFTSPTYLDID